MVMVLISIMAAVGIPLYRRSVISSNEVAGMKALRTLCDAELQFNTMYRRYGLLPDLGPAGKNFLVDPALATGVRSGYLFTVEVDDPTSSWHAIATPQYYGSTGFKTYYIDESGTVRASDLAKSGVVPRAVAEAWPVVE